MSKCKDNPRKPKRQNKVLTVARVDAIPEGRSATVQLNDGSEIALFKAQGKFYAIENFCPHKGVPLADSRLYGSIVECDWHGWQFDLRSGKCLTKPKCSIETYEVRIEDGWIKIVV
ncbi:MAG: Rieske (2Fe-2S) protein [Pyrinomonadaceae bacterium]|nr:Rieske (2Fe-2S) protein [Pyrinomonadaceae bacterium]MCX7640049.1 Rieske (2Fe-2S) protein [Pyrinomonadaceae bacterium]MDW8304221.1 Rieske (2Fe-2S) protein [Acidobacteriota bacterium]